MDIFIRWKWPLSLINHYRFTNDINAVYDIAFIFFPIFARIPKCALKRILQIVLELSATKVVFQSIWKFEVLMNKILAIRLHNQLFFWQNWIVFLKWWTFAKDLSCTEMIISDRKVLELHGILFFSNLNPDLARMNNFHVSCILLTALFRYYFYCRWSLPLFNSRCIKSSISTTWRAENIWVNLNNLRRMSPC